VEITVSSPHLEMYFRVKAYALEFRTPNMPDGNIGSPSCLRQDPDGNTC